MAPLLILNPNTRQALTDQLVAQVQAWWTPHAPPGRPLPRLAGLTAPHGADYIASETTYVIASHAALDAWRLYLGDRPQALLVACFGDPGVWALREVSGVPVMGLAEAAMREAQALGPFGILTGGQAWGPMLMRLARGLQCAGPDALVAVHTVAASGGEMAAHPEAAWDQLAQGAVELLQAQPALRSLILGGAALGGWVGPVQERLAQRALQGDIAAVPRLIDSVEAGARWLWRSHPG